MAGSGKEQITITLNDLSRVVKSLTDGTVLLVTDPVVYKINALSEKLSSLFTACLVKRIDVTAGLLTVESLEPIYTEFAGSHPGCIIALGGGTVMDTAKLMNMILSYNITPSDLIHGAWSNRPLIPAVAIPTTAGTGSEATHFAVVYRDKTKYSIADDNLVPDYVILDPELTLSMPRNTAAYTGFDAFAQAIESYWSINATDESKEYSREAISLIKTYFSESVLQNSLQARDAMQKAANLAGKAINIAQTTASHSISYPMSSFFGIPHGLAVFLTLPSIFAFNQEVTESDCTDIRGVAYVRDTMATLAEMVAESGKDPKETLYFRMAAFSVDTHLSAYGISDQDAIACILDNGFNPQRMKNNPRKITRNDLSRLLQDLL